VKHTYDKPGEYYIQIREMIPGGFPGISFAGTAADRNKLIDVKSWGTIQWKTMAGAFKGAKNLNISATNAPDLSKVTTMEQMFMDATSFNSDISHWDVSNVTAMNGLFRGASSFNQDISDWDVSKVTNMNNMFNGASSFSQNIREWCVSKITTAPSGFATNSPLANNDAYRPDWGKCSRGDFVFTRTVPSGTTCVNGNAAGNYTIDW
jgi:surface protein